VPDSYQADWRSLCGSFELETVWLFLLSRGFGLPIDRPRIWIWSEAPTASGLSTSSATIMSLIDLILGRYFEGPFDSLRLSYECEFAVTQGGGMDQASIWSGGCILTEGKNLGPPLLVKRIAWPSDWVVTVLDSGIRKNSSQHIRLLRDLVSCGNSSVASYRDEVEQSVLLIDGGIHSSNLSAVNEGLARAHSAMRDLQDMSTRGLEKLREMAEKRSGCNFKLTGSGSGGCLIAVHLDRDTENVHESLASLDLTAGSAVRCEVVPEYHEVQLVMENSADV